MITIFSWWQCIVRSRASSAQATFVPAVNPSHAARAIARVGWNTGAGGPAHSSSRTGSFSASPPSNSLSFGSPGSRVSRKSGLACQFAMCTCERAPARACAITGNAAAPSMCTHIRLPGRGARSPAAQHRTPVGDSASDQPSRFNRRR